MNSNRKKIIILATEPSGDLLGSKLIKSLKEKDKNILFYGIGGEKMQSIGFKSWFSISYLSVNGYYEVFIKLFKLIYYIKKTISYIKEINPDILITIDSPSFNFRVVKRLQFLRKKSKFIHYVAPSVWAWKSYRAKDCSKNYDLMLTLFPFEPKYFRKYKLKTFFVGHPIFYETDFNYKNLKKNIISFYPGSRINEVKKTLPIMISLIESLRNDFPNFRYKILTIKSLKIFLLANINKLNIEVIDDDFEKEKIMKKSYLAIAASGTISLELASKNVPMIIVYDTSVITAFIINKLVKVKYASLINIIFDKEVVPEFLFNRFKKEGVLKKTQSLLRNTFELENQKKHFFKLKKKLLLKSKDPSILAANKILGLK